MSATASALALVLGLIAVGLLVRRTGLMAASHADGLNRFVTTVCVPAIVLALVPTMTFRTELLVLVVVPWVLLGLVAPGLAALGRHLRLERDATAALLLCVPLGNTSFLGFPMISALLGEPAVRLALVYDQLGSFLMLALWGALVTAHTESRRPYGRDIVRRVAYRALTFPPLIALAFAGVLAWLRHPPPELAVALFRRVGDALVPVAMFAVGLQLEFRMARAEVGAFVLGLLVKMGVMPLVAYGLAHALGARGEVLRVATLESAMPPMITAGALATSAGLRPRLCAALVGYGVAAAMVVIPLWSLVH